MSVGKGLSRQLRVVVESHGGDCRYVASFFLLLSEWYQELLLTAEEMLARKVLWRGGNYPEYQHFEIQVAMRTSQELYPMQVSIRRL
jgi:hypothetical protein